MAGRAAVILAAGASRRMGQPKPLLAWQHTTLLGWCLEQLRGAHAEPIVVVLGSVHEQVRAAVPELADATVVLNLDEASERSGSIRLAAQALAVDAGSLIVQSVDQPCSSTVLDALFVTREGEDAAIVVPTYRGRRGHPICVAARLIAELREVSEATEGLRAVVRAHQVTELPVLDEAVVWNLNDPAAYAAARALQGD